MSGVFYSRYLPPEKARSHSPRREPKKTSSGADFSYARWVPPETSKLPAVAPRTTLPDAGHDRQPTKTKKRKHGTSSHEPEAPRKNKRSKKSKRTRESDGEEDDRAIESNHGDVEIAEEPREKQGGSNQEENKDKDKEQSSIVIERQDAERFINEKIRDALPIHEPTEALVQGDFDTEAEAREAGKNKKKKNKQRSHVEGPTETTEPEDAACKVDQATHGREDTDGEQPLPMDGESKEDRKKRKEERKTKKKGKAEAIRSADRGTDLRHRGILAKKDMSLNLSLKKTEEPTQEEEFPQTDGIKIVLEEVHGLEPLPQPEPVSLENLDLPDYETLPSWLASPIKVSPDKKESFENLGIHPKACRILESRGFREAFAVQTAAIPLLLPSAKHRQGDLLVAAATGSGKTLAYAVPIVRDLSEGVITRLRALVVLPTRELIRQAQEVFELCSHAFASKDRKRVSIGIAMGSQALKHEQGFLVEREELYDPKAWEEAAQKKRLRLEDEDQDSDDGNEAQLGKWPDFMAGYNSKVDILICTPGRLVEHINQTPGFSLDYVRWLVVDEADKLLSETYQGWLDVTMPKLVKKTMANRCFPGSNLNGVRKVILSATLTRDTSLLGGLQLRFPQLIVLEGEGAADTTHNAQHTLPDLLVESAVRVRDANLKPLYLLELLQSSHVSSKSIEDGNDKAGGDATAADAQSPAATTSSEEDEGMMVKPDMESTELSEIHSSFPTSVLIFTKSNESAMRLSRLLALLSPSLDGQIGTLTSTMKTSHRRRTLKLFASRTLRILVASDLVARGIDLPLLDHVVNYDLPASVAGYIHRVGRTARAGRPGHAWTLLPDDESGWFWGKIAKGAVIRRAGKVERVKIGEVEGDPFAREVVKKYELALEKLGDEAGEARRRERR